MLHRIVSYRIVSFRFVEISRTSLGEKREEKENETDATTTYSIRKLSVTAFFVFILLTRLYESFI